MRSTSQTLLYVINVVLIVAVLSRKNLFSGVSREQVVEMLLDEGSFFPSVNGSCFGLLVPCLPIILELCVHWEACRKQIVTVPSELMTER